MFSGQQSDNSRVPHHRLQRHEHCLVILVDPATDYTTLRYILSCLKYVKSMKMTASFDQVYTINITRIL